MTPNHDNRPRGGGLLLGISAALLVAACCALLPLLIAGGAITGIGGFFRNPWVISAGTALLILAVVASIPAIVASIRRHRSKEDPSTTTKDDQSR